MVFSLTMFFLISSYFLAINHLEFIVSGSLFPGKEFFEEFYHLATGFNYDIDTGIPKDETEAEMYLTRLQEEFDEKMKIKLGEKYLPGNNDPDTINSK